MNRRESRFPKKSEIIPVFLASAAAGLAGIAIGGTIDKQPAKTVTIERVTPKLQPKAKAIKASKTPSVASVPHCDKSTDREMYFASYEAFTKRNTKIKLNERMIAEQQAREFGIEAFSVFKYQRQELAKVKDPELKVELKRSRQLALGRQAVTEAGLGSVADNLSDVEENIHYSNKLVTRITSKNEREVIRNRQDLQFATAAINLAKDGFYVDSHRAGSSKDSNTAAEILLDEIEDSDLAYDARVAAGLSPGIIYGTPPAELERAAETLRQTIQNGANAAFTRSSEAYEEQWADIYATTDDYLDLCK